VTRPGDIGLAKAAAFGSVKGLALDRAGSNLYVADCGRNWVAKVDLATSRISTVGGLPDAPYEENGAASQVGLNCPSAIAVGPDGAVYLLDGKTNVRKVINQRITTTAGLLREDTKAFYDDGRPATETKLVSLQGLAVDARGGVYVTDGFNRVRFVDPAIGLMTTRA